MARRRLQGAKEYLKETVTGAAHGAQERASGAGEAVKGAAVSAKDTTADTAAAAADKASGAAGYVKARAAARRCGCCAENARWRCALRACDAASHVLTCHRPSR